MRKHRHHDEAPHGGASSGVSAATVEDLAAIEAELAEAERLRASVARRLAAVRARGDGEVAVGMPVVQHLRHRTRLRRDVLDAIAVVGDVLGDLPGIRAALAAGVISVDQAAAVCGHAARVGLTLRRALDTELADDTAWHGWSPEHLAAEVGRLLASLTPQVAGGAERTAGEREFLYVQPALDGQALRFTGRYEGVNAALFDAVLQAAAPAPRRGERRGPQLARGLARVLTEWAHGRGAKAPDGPPVTIHLLVDEATATEGAAAEVWTSTPGLAPTLTADAVARLHVEATITSIGRNGVPVAVAGRAGHAIDDPARLSWDSLVELVRVRDGDRCRMPGCDRPLDDVHHLVHRAHGGRDHTFNLAGLCRRCHHRVLHGRAWHGHVDHDGRLHLRRGRQHLTSPARKHLRLRRPPPLADPDAATDEHPIHLDRFGQPLPF